MSTAIETRGAAALRTVTKSDTTELSIVQADGSTLWPRAIWVGGAGDVAILAQGDTLAVTLANVPAGSLLDVKARRVMSTNTSATSIVALY